MSSMNVIMHKAVYGLLLHLPYLHGLVRSAGSFGVGVYNDMIEDRTSIPVYLILPTPTPPSSAPRNVGGSLTNEDRDGDGVDDGEVVDSRVPVSSIRTTGCGKLADGGGGDTCVVSIRLLSKDHKIHGSKSILHRSKSGWLRGGGTLLITDYGAVVDRSSASTTTTNTFSAVDVEEVLEYLQTLNPTCVIFDNGLDTHNNNNNNNTNLDGSPSNIDQPVSSSSITDEGLEEGKGRGGGCNNTTANVVVPPAFTLPSVYSHFFADCGRLTTLVLPPRINTTTTLSTTNGNHTYYNNPSLPTYTIATHIIPAHFLSSCTNLRHVSLDCFNSPRTSLQQERYNHSSSTTTTHISEFFLAHCASLTSISLAPFYNTTITSISPYFLANCKSLKAINLAPLQHIRSIPEYFMCGCSSLEELDLSPFGEREVVADYAAPGGESCGVRVGGVRAARVEEEGGALSRRYEGGVASIGACFLSGCSSLTHINLHPLFARHIQQRDPDGDDVGGGGVDIADYYQCHKDRTIAVGDCFLSGCRGLLYLELSPLSHPHITSIGNYFLSGCEKLRGVDSSPLALCQLSRKPDLLVGLDEHQFMGYTPSRGLLGCLLA